MGQTTLGIGTRLQHTQFGPGVIVGIKYATYLISFINHGIKEIDKTDDKLDEIIPENLTEEIETHSEAEKSLLKILRLWGGITENVPLGEKWIKGTILLQPADKSLKPKEIPVEDFFHKIVMLRDRLRVLEPAAMDHSPPLMYCSKTKSNGLPVKKEIGKINFYKAKQAKSPQLRLHQAKTNMNARAMIPGLCIKNLLFWDRYLIPPMYTRDKSLQDW
jgi:hypothetical protein